MKRGERADRALISGIQPAGALAPARRPRDRLHELGAIGLIALDAARRERPVDLLRGELMLARELRRVNGALDVLHARDLRVDPLVLEVAALHPRVVVGRPVVHPVEREARIVADHRAEVVRPPHNTLWLAVCPVNTSMGFVVPGVLPRSASARIWSSLQSVPSEYEPENKYPIE